MSTPTANGGDTPENRHIVGVADAAASLGVTPRTVVRWADSGELPLAFRTRGGHRRFYQADVDAYLERLKAAPAPDDE